MQLWAALLLALAGIGLLVAYIAHLQRSRGEEDQQAADDRAALDRARIAKDVRSGPDLPDSELRWRD